MSSILILHGWGHSAAQWLQFAQMCHDHEVVRFDLPGFGDARLIAPDWGVPEYGEWVQKQINTNNEKIVLLGHSFGGRVAAYIASRRPSWLSKLVLVGAPCLYQPSQKTRLLKRIAKVGKLLGMQSDVFSLNAELTEAERKGLGDIYRRVVIYDQLEELKHIEVPTLIVRGDADTYPGAEVGTRMHELIAQSEYRVLPHVGHNIHLENPTLLYGVVNSFIQQ